MIDAQLFAVNFWLTILPEALKPLIYAVKLGFTMSDVDFLPV